MQRLCVRRECGKHKSLKESQDVYRVETQDMGGEIGRAKILQTFEGHGEEFCLHPRARSGRPSVLPRALLMFRFPFKEITLEIVRKLDLEAGKGRHSQAKLEANAVPQTKMAVGLDEVVVGTEKSRGLIPMSEVKSTELDNGLDMEMMEKE